MIEQLKINVLGSYHITNCYIIWDKDTKECAIVDPADRYDIISEKVKKLDLSVKYVLLTHAHKDHTIALNKLIDNYNVKVISSIKEKDMLQGKVNDCSEVFGLKQISLNMDDFIFLDDEEEINIGNIKIKIIYTPGHTKGSACYYIKAENVLITGDTLFSDCFGRCDLDSASIDDMINSLIKLYKEYNNVYIYPGHGEIGMKLKYTYNNVKRILKNSFNIELDKLLNEGDINESF